MDAVPAAWTVAPGADRERVGSLSPCAGSGDGSTAAARDAAAGEAAVMAGRLCDRR